jgi:hypothetical protein
VGVEPNELSREEKIDWIYDALRKLMPVVEKLLKHPMLNRWLGK